MILGYYTLKIMLKVLFQNPLKLHNNTLVLEKQVKPVKSRRTVKTSAKPRRWFQKTLSLKEEVKEVEPVVKVKKRYFPEINLEPKMVSDFTRNEEELITDAITFLDSVNKPLQVVSLILYFLRFVVSC